MLTVVSSVTSLGCYWCFWIVVLEKTLESPLDCKEIKPVNSKGNQLWIFIQGVMLKLKLQNFGHVMQRAVSLENTLILGKIEDKRRRGWQRMRWLNSIISSMDMNLSKCREMVEVREAWHAAVHGVAKSQIGLSDWTTTTNIWNLIGKQCKCILLSVLTEGNIYLWCLVCFEQLL